MRERKIKPLREILLCCTLNLVQCRRGEQHEGTIWTEVTAQCFSTGMFREGLVCILLSFMLIRLALQKIQQCARSLAGVTELSGLPKMWMLLPWFMAGARLATLLIATAVRRHLYQKLSMCFLSQTPNGLLLTPSPLLSSIHFWSSLSPVAPLSPARLQGPNTLFQVSVWT